MDFAVWVTNECNMKCKYCYVEAKRGAKYFSGEDVLQLIHFMKETGKKDEKIKISFFGGEPLLNFNLIRMIIDFIDEKKPFAAEYYLTTNGLLVTEQMARYFAEKKVFVSLSWDGCETANDTNRVDRGGFGTFQRVRKAYCLLKKCGLDNVRVRATFNSETITYLMDSVEAFLNEDPDISVMFAPDYFDRYWSDEALTGLQEMLKKLSEKDLNNIAKYTIWL